jgi:hypothetical protein
MKYLGLASVVVLTLSLGMFIPPAGAPKIRRGAAGGPRTQEAGGLTR